MFTGVSSVTRGSHHAAISSACSLVCAAAKRQPVEPVQATSPARSARGFRGEAERRDRRFGERDLVVRHAGDQQVLPHREADIAVAEIGGDLREAAHLRHRDLADRKHDADPVQSRLLLRAHTDMRRAIEGRPRLDGLGRRARELLAKLLLDGGEEFLKAPGIEHVFQPRLVAVGAVAILDEDAHDGVGDFGGVLRLHQHAGVAREIAMAGDAAEREAKPDARLDAVPVDHLDRLEADVVGVLQHRNDAAAVEADVELARQAVERAVIQDVEVPLARIRPRVDQLLAVDAGRGEPVTLRMLSAPEPRDHRPRLSMPSTTSTACFGSISRICKFARVVTCA